MSNSGTDSTPSPRRKRDSSSTQTSRLSRSELESLRQIAEEAGKKTWPSLEMIESMEQSDRTMKQFLKENGDGDHSYHGDISYDELRRLTGDYFRWPVAESEREEDS